MKYKPIELASTFVRIKKTHCIYIYKGGYRGGKGDIPPPWAISEGGMSPPWVLSPPWAVQVGENYNVPPLSTSGGGQIFFEFDLFKKLRQEVVIFNST